MIIIQKYEETLWKIPYAEKRQLMALTKEVTALTSTSLYLTSEKLIQTEEVLSI